jgi:chromate reductase
VAHSRFWSIPGALKNAIDWASRPWGTNSFAQKPSAMIGTSPGAIGTAVAQQNLRNAVEAYIRTEPGLFTDTGEVTDENGAHFLRDYVAEFREFIARVLIVLPGQA